MPRLDSNHNRSCESFGNVFRCGFISVDGWHVSYWQQMRCNYLRLSMRLSAFVYPYHLHQMSLTSNEPSSAQVFRIPELACMISNHLGRKDTARLGCTCRELFSLLMPRAWEYVSDATRILSLIRGSHISTEPKNGCVIIVSATVLSCFKGGITLLLGVAEGPSQ